jgi:hypothetical protein
LKAIIVVRDNSNLFPASWEFVNEDHGWVSLYPLGRESKNVLLHARLMASDETRSCFAVFASNDAVEDRLSALAGASSRAWTLQELKSDNGALATAIKALWRDRRESDNDISFHGSIAGWRYVAMLENGE